MNHLLTTTFKKTHVDAAVKHFNGMVGDFQKRDWADSAAKGGKFIEAVLKALWDYAGQVVPKGKAFSAGSIIDQLANKTTVPDTIRQTIPRACRFAYEIASNRGARHDADEIDANEMDATAVLSACSWILSEMVRFSQKGLDLAQAKAIVDGLMKRRFPFSENIDGHLYVDIAESAPEVALLVLFDIYPGRMSKNDLIKTIVRHGHKLPNAKMAVMRAATIVDDDGNGNLKLRSTGLRQAEALISARAK